MPWRQSGVMDERRALMQEFERGERTRSELCRVFGVSRKSAYKCWARYRALGEAGLSDRSRAPLNHPNAVSPEVAAHLIRLRKRHSDWGPQTLLWWLERHEPALRLPAVSTVAQLLKRAGLVKPRRLARRAVPYGHPFVAVDAPNALWSADFKGHFRMGVGRYCYPLTISDGYSRFLIECRGLLRPSLAQVRPWFERAFRTYGLPQAIRTDNGQPVASDALAGLTQLSLWWLKLGIYPERIAPGHPQHNARHERMHGTLKRKGCVPRTDLASQQRAFDRFRAEYNRERPHHALSGQPPAMRYAPSPRIYPSKLPELQYPSAMHVKRVLPSGGLRWLGKRMYFSSVLAGEPVGLQEIGDGLWQIHVGPLAVARIDARHLRIDPIKPHYIEVPTLH